MGGADAKLFLGAIEASDIQQGSLGDCYFLSSLAALAEKRFPDENGNEICHINKIFLHSELNDEGIYAVKIYKNGIPTVVFVDEMVPVKDG